MANTSIYNAFERMWEHIVFAISNAIDYNAAPAGYGLGRISGKFVSDCNDALANGWYATSEGTLNCPKHNGVNLGFGTIFVESRNERTHQTYWASTSGIFAHLQRYSMNTGGTWSEWEWVNPPLSPGVEYRTTERFEGKPVYAKLINFGSLPANTSGHIKHGISGVDKIVSCDLSFFNNTDTYSAPYFENGTIKAYAQANATYVTVGTTANYSTYTGVVALKYTKK